MSFFEGLQKFFKHLPRKEDSEVKPLGSEAPISGPAPQAALPSSPPTEKPVGKTKQNKHGIPLLKGPAEDLFLDMETSAPQHPQTTSQDLVCLKKKPVSFSKAPGSQDKKAKISRKGLPILPKDADLFLAMQSSSPPHDNTGRKLPSHVKKKVRVPAARTKPLSRDKNGIPILKDQTDFTRIFNTREEDSLSHTRPSGHHTSPPYPGQKEKAGEFPSVLLQNLGLKNQDVLLREKKAGTPKNAPISLEERLRRYPKPQKTLDLHGFSGIQARLKTEIFLEEAQRQGFFTVRIIVGRGLHSQGPAVLPDIVDQKLREMEGAGTLLAWKWEHETDGGPSGSVHVFLKHFR
ncbi:Smr/MutS family protein [Desulfobotulus sp.]|jgi:hypothetical protein|uniref:Smr/MutS family protein n=1 Tax=Desulfobotulus sp. TaxID=1940337 RepID=UPI002A36E379|nr:Smr/MutS family protein [Desulfobotulus sp.]MDY0161966.1 Smr/MutS family protein [Desulfobotulus sp.]